MKHFTIINNKMHEHSGSNIHHLKKAQIRNENMRISKERSRAVRANSPQIN